MRLIGVSGIERKFSPGYARAQIPDHPIEAADECELFGTDSDLGKKQPLELRPEMAASRASRSIRQLPREERIRSAANAAAGRGCLGRRSRRSSKNP
jgi:hypothetical protein